MCACMLVCVCVCSLLYDCTCHLNTEGLIIYHLSCVSRCNGINVFDIRTCGLAALLLLEAFKGWSFVSYLLSRRGDAKGGEKTKQPTKKNKETKVSEKKKN